MCVYCYTICTNFMRTQKMIHKTINLRPWWPETGSNYYRPRRSRSAAAYIVVKLSRKRSVGRSVGLSVRPVHCGKNGGSDSAAVWHRRSNGSRDEAGGGVWRSVYGKGYFCGEFGARHCNQRDFTAYVSDSAATRPSSQVTLGRLVNLLI